MTTASTKSASANSAADDLRELTPRAIVIGVILAVILGAANAYLGLYAGLTVSASIPAAVVSMAILRVLGGSTILENNVAQTVASAGEAVAAGAIFTFPALVILGFKGNLPYLDVTALCLAGGTMGSLLVVFLRRAYIVEEKLPFPEGVACAEVLRAGAKSVNAAPLLYGGIISALLKTSQDIAGLIPGMLFRRAMDRRRSLRGFYGYFGGAARCRIHRRHQNRDTDFPRRFDRMVRRGSDRISESSRTSRARRLCCRN